MESSKNRLCRPGAGLAGESGRGRDARQLPGRGQAGSSSSAGCISLRAASVTLPDSDG